MAGTPKKTTASKPARRKGRATGSTKGKSTDNNNQEPSNDETTTETSKTLAKTTRKHKADDDGEPPEPKVPRLNVNGKDIVQIYPAQETEDDRRQVKRNLKLNPASSYGVFVARPVPNTNSRQTWLMYSLGFEDAFAYME